MFVFEEDSFKFLHLDKEEFEPHIQKIKSESLKNCLRHGIGYMHEHTSEADAKQLKLIFQAGATQVIVVERSLVWGLYQQANMVVVLGTSYYDGALHSHEDYQISDLMKMIGFAQLPSQREVLNMISENIINLHTH